MKYEKRAVVDLSSLIWGSLKAGRDVEFGREVPIEGKEGKTAWVNSAEHGYENAIAYLLEAMKDIGLQPYQLIIVMEGMNSKSQRQAIHPNYKLGRDKVPEEYVEFNLCKERVINALLSIGAQLCWQDNGVEADDVIGYLCLHLKGEVWVISGDKDLAQCVGGRVHHWRAGAIDKNPFGQDPEVMIDFPHRHIPVWIALVGDSGDKIPGAKGFGKKKGRELIEKFGEFGLDMMLDLIKTKQLHRLKEDVASMPALQVILDDQPGVYMSYELGRLRVEKINTMRMPLKWRAGMVRPKETIEDERLTKYGGVTRIISAETYASAVEWLKGQLAVSPHYALDVETSTPDESDDYLERKGKAKGNKVDTFGSDLTSLQLTFGRNRNFTVYLPCDNVEEPGISNLTAEQIAAVVDMLDRDKLTYIHNVAFELPVCYNAWGHLWKDDPLYHGFLRNVRDTAIASSYADENRSRGLKSLSKDVLGYDQQNYDDVTTKVYLAEEWAANPVGKLKETFDDECVYENVRVIKRKKIDGKMQSVTVNEQQLVSSVKRVRVQHKMNELTARHCLSYGADDCVTAVALANHFNVIMEIEDTDHVYEEVETWPAYLTALAFVQGTNFSLESMAKQEKDDDKDYNEAWVILREYLIKIGFEGTKCPVMTDAVPKEEEFDAPDTDEDDDEEGEYKPASHELTYCPKDLKRVFSIVAGFPLEKTLVRKMDKLAKLMQVAVEGHDDEDLVQRVEILAAAVEQKDLVTINSLLTQYYSGEPVLKLNSPKQMKVLLYDFMKIPVKVINDLTPKEYETKPLLAEAVSLFKKIRAGSSQSSLTEAQKLLMRAKAKTDDTAVDFAIAFDTDVLDDEARVALKALGRMKKVMTRRTLFYNKYWNTLHWKDRKLHSYCNQCAAVTRRYSMSDENLQQLPKKGEAVRFRSHFLPHEPEAVICSIDFVGQELRLAAEKSQDKNMLACYVGDKLKDIHSITAAGAMPLKWGSTLVDDMFKTYGADLPTDSEGMYELFMRLRKVGKEAPIGKKADDLRKDAKNVNFGAQNGAMAVKLAETLIMRVEDAQLFLDAREAMFPGVAVAAERAADIAMDTGCAFTFMGARRHLRDAILNDERGGAARAERQAWNHEIQSSAGEMTKLAMKRMWLRGIFFKYNAQFIAPIHDECVSSVHKNDAVEFIREKHWCMTQPYSTMTVPILGSISIGKNFAEQIECGDWFIEDEIKKALDKIFHKEVANA